MVSVGDEAQYDALAQIAATVGLRTHVATNRAAVGQPKEGQRLVVETETFLADTAQEHPEFAGKTISVLLTSPDGSGVYTGTDTPPPTRMQLLTGLEFVPSPLVASLGTTRITKRSPPSSSPT